MNTTLQQITKGLGALIITSLVLFIVWYFSEVVVYILVSAVLAVMFRPLVSALLRIKLLNKEMPRWTAATITLFVIWGISVLLSWLICPLIFSKVNQLSSLDMTDILHNIEEPIMRFQHYLQQSFSLPSTDFSLKDSIITSINSVVDTEAINNIFASIFNIAISAIISFFSISFITFFFLKDDGLFYNMVKGLFPDKYQNNVTRALDSVSELLARYFIGILSESLIIASVISFALMAFGMSTSNAIFTGVVMGVINVIPYAGPVIGSVFTIFLVMIDPITGMTSSQSAIILACVILATKTLDDFILQPVIYSKRVKAHPLEIFIVILLAGYVAGVLGMLLAIPSYTVIRVFAKEFFSQFSLVKKLTDKI